LIASLRAEPYPGVRKETVKHTREEVQEMNRERNGKRTP
jgi:hypothetical protein